jgi:hypothetical protein
MQENMLDSWNNFNPCGRDLLVYRRLIIHEVYAWLYIRILPGKNTRLLLTNMHSPTVSVFSFIYQPFIFFPGKIDTSLASAKTELVVGFRLITDPEQRTIVEAPLIPKPLLTPAHRIPNGS